jgi:hypothetical protein
MQDTKRSLNPDFYKIINLGQKRLISSLLWIDTLLNTDHEHYKKEIFIIGCIYDLKP